MGGEDEGIGKCDAGSMGRLCVSFSGNFGNHRFNEMTKPQEELKKEVKRHAECLDRDNKRIAEQEEMTRLTLRGVNALLNHEITGNGIENLKKVRDDITEHLIDK